MSTILQQAEPEAPFNLIGIPIPNGCSMCGDPITHYAHSAFTDARQFPSGPTVFLCQKHADEIKQDTALILYPPMKFPKEQEQLKEEVEQHTDNLFKDTLKKIVIDKQVILYKGLKVQWIRLTVGTDGLQERLAWCLYPLERTYLNMDVQDEVKNPFCWSDYIARDGQSYKDAVLAVAKTFDDCHQELIKDWKDG